MTYKQALEIIEQARLFVQGDGKTHDKLREAVQLLASLVDQQPTAGQTPIDPSK